MAENNIIGIVGTLTETPVLILDAPSWDKKIFEAKIKAERRSGTADILIVEIPTTAAKSKKDFEKLQEGSEVLIVGEIRTQDIEAKAQTDTRVRIFVHANMITLNDPPADRQNEVKLRGNICKDPRSRQTTKGMPVTDIMIAVNEKSGSYYIPCICWQNVAEVAAGLKKGAYVEVEGRFQSREYKKRIEGGVPFLMTAYEVSVVQLGIETDQEQETETLALEA